MVSRNSYGRLGGISCINELTQFVISLRHALSIEKQKAMGACSFGKKVAPLGFYRTRSSIYNL